MKFVEKLKKLGKKTKAALCMAMATVGTAAITVCANAAETTEETAPTMKSMLSDAGTTLTTSFNDLIQTLIPVVMGIVGSGLVLFGIIALVKFAKKVFGKVAG